MSFGSVRFGYKGKTHSSRRLLLIFMVAVERTGEKNACRYVVKVWLVSQAFLEMFWYPDKVEKLMAVLDVAGRRFEGLPWGKSKKDVNVRPSSHHNTAATAAVLLVLAALDILHLFCIWHPRDLHCLRR